MHSQDILNAIHNVGFPHLVPELMSWHSAFMEEKENAPKPKKKNNKKASEEQGEEDGEGKQESNVNDDE